jgi:hypothetical protein
MVRHTHTPLMGDGELVAAARDEDREVDSG